MSYALETKKRKFDRILESLTDGGSSQPRTSLNSRNNNNNASAASLVPGTDNTASLSSEDGSKRRRHHANNTTNSSSSGLLAATTKTAAAGTGSTASLTGHYLPSSRAAFLERLETFRLVTKWHVPSTGPINASVWAKRGWICVDTDTVLCGSCKEKFNVDLDLDRDNIGKGGENDDDENENENENDNGVGADETDDAEEESFMVAKEVYDGVVKRYLDMVVTAHAESCPWRKRGSDSSVQRIEGLLNTFNAVSGLQARYEGIMSRPDEVPNVTILPEVTGDREIARIQFGGEPEKLSFDGLRLAVCGWERKDVDVVECRYCFRSLGLWLYRGEDPTMEQLDAVESHLEYCPWRSAEAQDTEVTVTRHAGKEVIHTKERIPGWLLVCQAVAKSNTKKRGSATEIASVASERNDIPPEAEAATPEQREKKMKDLMKRIKDLKKPFNVKSLLKKKTNPKA